jgi:DNA-binding FadR family transcriptional regulator
MQEIILLSSVPPTADDPELWDVPSHPPILGALCSGDADEAKRALSEHFASRDERYAAFDAQPFREAGLAAIKSLSDHERRRSSGEKA